MLFGDFSIINSVLSLLYGCFGIAFALGIMLASYNIPYYILKWVMYEEEKKQQQARKSFDFEEEEDSLLLSKLFKKDK